ncbi:cupin domain-containing protein [Parasphingopyxis sp. CP4]|uniref:cupin domain-containing protein n=1 Tax=Parasphingopyxis sp. CP4 TaxID=2724527 RepID=UPI0015A046B6|nr:cupin domain-containing protein [Parasphingopyxis sp. CP4]QLC20783.1 cupin domain-containing protein [Parasphingopyxis sp. CP4]
MVVLSSNKSARFIHADATPVEDLGDGIRRQLLGYNDDLMAVRVWFEEGAVGEAHTHPHSQTSYVESGRFLVTIDGEESELGPGDGFFVAPHEMHGAVCLEAGVLLDMFNPVRADFLGLDEAQS